MKRKSELEINESNDLKKGAGLFNSLESIPKFIGNNSARNYKIQGKFNVYTINTLSELISEVRRGEVRIRQ